MSATTNKSITVTDASSQLGLSESDFRGLLKGIYKNPTTVKKISLDNYKLIAETMQQRATEESETQIESETELENSTIEEDIQSLNTQIEPEQELKGSTIEDNSQPIEESVSLAATDLQALDIPQDRAKIQLNINLNLTNQVLDLNKISSALAIVAGEAAVRNFEELYTHTVNSGIDRVIQTVASQTYSTIQRLNEVDNADFLTQKGRDTSTVDTQTAIDLVCQFL